MTESDLQRLADFDARAAGWRNFFDNEAGWPRIHREAMFLRRLLRESEAERERRQTELLAANNREVERRRAAEAIVRKVKAALDEEGDGPHWGLLHINLHAIFAAAEAPERPRDG